MKSVAWHKGLLIMPYGLRREGKKSHKLLIIAGAALAFSLFVFYLSLPSVKNIEFIAPVSGKILDRNGRVLYEIYGEHRSTPIKLEETSVYLKQATLAAEDKTFYSHKGVSLSAIARAAYADIKHGGIVQGGSTISQQTVKNLLLNSNRSFERKFKEAVLAFSLESRFSKDKILEIYLNTIPYGRNAYGVEAASLVYFGKSAKDLGLAESAYLAALPKAPSFYSPTGPNFKYLKQRQTYILNAMQEQGQIGAEENLAAQKQVVDFKSASVAMEAPYFTKWVEQYLESKYGRKALEEQGFMVYTSLDLDLQKEAEKILEEGIKRNSKYYNAHNAALVAIDPNNGQVLAMVGGAGYFKKSYPEGCVEGKNCRFDPQVNAALAPRQPGSSFKPYTYVTAFSPEFGFAPASPILDERQNFSPPGIKPYTPKNFNGAEHGLITMRKALAGSLNIPAVRTLSMIGVENVVETVKKLGITTPMENCGLSLTLGACEVKLLDHAAAFSAFANGGYKVTPTPILRITDKRGKVLEDNSGTQLADQVLNPEAVYELVSVLSDNRARSYIFGSSSPLTLKSRPVAAKTGTSQDFKDAWTMGFTPQIVTGIWVGNNDGTLIRSGGDGVVVAAPMWRKFMEYAHKDKPVLAFNKPTGITEATVSASSGKLATEFTQDKIKEVFASYSVPKDFDPYKPPEDATSTPSNLALDINIPPPGLKMPVLEQAMYTTPIQ